MKQAVWLAAALMMLLPLGKVYSKERSERENNTLRIMSYNIRNGRGMDDVTDFRRTARGSRGESCPAYRRRAHFGSPADSGLRRPSGQSARAPQAASRRRP